MPVETATDQTRPVADTGIWPWVIGGALLLGLLAWLGLRRRRAVRDDYRTDEFVEGAYVAEDSFEPADPAFVAATPAIASAEPEIETAALSGADPEDLALVAAGSEPVGERPWLELMMRPIRAGTDGDEARVDFELTVGNTGNVAANDVRISSWMFAAGSAQESDMERMLIEPPAEATLSEVTIPPGDGAKVEASMVLPREGFDESVLPVVVADARYRLPDGSEGRISASFAIGHPVGEGLEPLRADDPDGLEGEVDSRLYGEVERV